MIDRILASLRALVESFTERQPMSFVWRYSVVEVSETTFSGRALSALCPFADMPNIPLMPGIAGAGVKPAVGSIAGVAFLDGDPSKPFVVCWDQTVPVSVTVDASEKLRVAPSTTAVEIGETATTIKIAGNGQPAVGRVGDHVDCGALTASGPVLTLTDGLGNVTAYTFTIALSSGTGTVSIAPSASGSNKGTITTGSGKVTCG